MRAIQIIGFKKSGKTSLALDLALELKRRGVNVACAKFTSHGLDKADTDTARMLEQGVPVAGLGKDDAAVFWPEGRKLTDLVPLLRAEVLVVEGGKTLGFMPRVLALREGDPATEAVELGADLALGSYGPVRAPGLTGLETVAQVADLVLEKGFILPGLNCGACGREDCRGLAVEIVAGEATFDDCAASRPGLEIKVNGQVMALNPFVDRIISASIAGMIKELRGWTPGPVEIRLET